jgi:hypothetical protein
MSKTLKPGTKVIWDSSQGEIHGTVKEKVTSTKNVKGHSAKATKDDPQYVVASDKTGAEAIHKPDALHLARKS